MSGTDKVKSAAKSVAEEAKSAALSAADTAKKEAQARAESARDGVADEVKTVASALRDASEDLRSGTPHERAIGQMAGTLADASDAIRNQDLGEMVNSVSDFARKNPAVFLSSAALLGFAAARFAKASDSAETSQGGYSGTQARTAQVGTRPTGAAASSHASRSAATSATAAPAVRTKGDQQ